jgi:cell division protein FtsN
VVSIYKVAPDTIHDQVKISIDKPTYQPIDNSKYYVIGGAFGVPQNAENYRKTLVKKGYKPVMLENVRSGLTHISLASFNSKEEAANFLSTIQSDITGAWILKQK